MSRIRQPAPRSLRDFGIWALAIWTALASLGNSTGMVLCIEDDGTISIETPAEQAACHHRQELAAAERPEFRAAGVGGCIDIPLSLSSAAALHRSHFVLGAAIERVDAGLLCLSLAQIGRTDSALALQWAKSESSPPSATLTSLRTIILLI
jgi:hypothetical protein